MKPIILVVLLLTLTAGCASPPPRPGNDAAVYEMVTTEWRNSTSPPNDKDGWPTPPTVHVVLTADGIEIPVPRVLTDVPPLDRYDLVANTASASDDVCGATRQLTVTRTDGALGLADTLVVDITEHWSGIAKVSRDDCREFSTLPPVDGDYASQLFFDVFQRCPQGCRDFPVVEDFYAYEETCGCGAVSD